MITRLPIGRSKATALSSVRGSPLSVPGTSGTTSLLWRAVSSSSTATSAILTAPVASCQMIVRSPAPGSGTFQTPPIQLPAASRARVRFPSNCRSHRVRVAGRAGSPAAGMFQIDSVGRSEGVSPLGRTKTTPIEGRIVISLWLAVTGLQCP